jgi:hypothetical protein
VTVKYRQGFVRARLAEGHSNSLGTFQLGPLISDSGRDQFRHGLAMDKEGNIYVSHPQLNRIQVFSHSGQFLYGFGEVETGIVQFNGISGI